MKARQASWREGTNSLLRLHSSDRHALKRELGWVISRLKECNFKLPCPSMTSGVQNQEAIEKQTKPVVSPYVICYVSARVVEIIHRGASQLLLFGEMRPNPGEAKAGHAPC